MSDKPVEPEDIVSDGVEEGSKPVPRDGGSAQHYETGAAGQSPEGKGPGSPDSQKVPGPAEEEDVKTADDRGLTTDTTPD
ncbi:MAG TPA: hypothetical protein VFN00_08375 [Arthrobacter sp.]|nr:hypothetical protein [Arthrobacter sp.]